MAAPPGIAVVTGGERGIGLEVCRRLGERGWTVALGARSAARAERAAANLAGDGLDVRGCVVDDDGPSGGFFRDGRPLAW